jgi:hypothetical protein
MSTAILPFGDLIWRCCWAKDVQEKARKKTTNCDLN